MQQIIYDWLDHTWVVLRAEGLPSLDAADQTSEVIQRFDAALNRIGLSLAATMRTRLWARTRDDRDQASRVRAAMLVDAARSASSSFIAPDWLDSDAAVAVELWAMQPDRSGVAKALVEYDPQIVPLRYLIRESVVVLSGVTSVLPTLADQTREILAGVEGSLAHAGSCWANAVKVSCFLHRSQSLSELRSLLAAVTASAPAAVEYGFVDGYSSEGKLIEIEVTARLP
jgi:enamine deaminase RidA (YjgF/YER057c/UK114 family)